MADAFPGPSHPHYTMDEVIEMLDDDDINEPVCEGSDDDLPECESDEDLESEER